MASAKETLEKIAKAIGIATDNVAESVKDTVENVAETTGEAIDNTVDAVKETVEDVKEAVEETVQDVKEVVADVIDDVADAVKETGEAIEDVAETIDPKQKEESPSEARVKELESQIDDLKEILKRALEEKTEKTEDVVPTPKVDDKGLTHSPETTVKTQGRKIGNKGGSIMSNVFKYINN